MIQSLRGMNDILESQRFEYFIEVATKIAKNYGFSYIETPLLEETALFKRSVGESSDIVGKTMFVCALREQQALFVHLFKANLTRLGETINFSITVLCFVMNVHKKGDSENFTSLEWKVLAKIACMKMRR